MKTSHRIISLLGSGSALALLLTIATPRAYAGPGIDYWTGKSKQAAEKAQVAKPVTVSGVVCAHSTTVPITEYKSDWPNGRGPRRAVQVGSKQVCDLCGGTTTFMKPSWPNGRGPLEAVTVAAKHDCTTACVKPPQA